MAEVTRREAISTLAATAGVGALLAATAEARANAAAAIDTYHHAAPAADLHVEWGIHHKPKEGEYTVRFEKGFSERPAVLLTPYWHDQGAEVGRIETLVHVDEKEFRGVSANAAENYFVMWLAIGRKRK
jgi:hypothetical protein